MNNLKWIPTCDVYMKTYSARSANKNQSMLRFWILIDQLKINVKRLNHYSI